MVCVMSYGWMLRWWMRVLLPSGRIINQINPRRLAVRFRSRQVLLDHDHDCGRSAAAAAAADFRAGASHHNGCKLIINGFSKRFIINWIIKHRNVLYGYISRKRYEGSDLAKRWSPGYMIPCYVNLYSPQQILQRFIKTRFYHNLRCLLFIIIFIW